jgi:hypothetical protein
MGKSFGFLSFCAVWVRVSVSGQMSVFDGIWKQGFSIFILFDWKVWFEFLMKVFGWFVEILSMNSFDLEEFLVWQEATKKSHIFQSSQTTNQSQQSLIKSTLLSPSQPIKPQKTVTKIHLTSQSI